MTRNAEQILKIITDSHEHLSSEQIFLRLKENNQSVVLATVYNNLAFLYKQGLIRKISVEGFPDRYDNVHRHDHLICKGCGKLSDILLEDLTQTLQNQLNIPMLSYDLKINYLCEDCKTALTNDGKTSTDYD